MRTLRLAKDLTLPLDAATESFAILGRRGSGKTHTAVVMAEEMLKAGVQVVVIDPLDVWWGLRVSKDGKTAGFPIYVAGGSHADIPLPADAGKVLADAVVDQGLSIVLSTRHLSKADQRRFVGDFCERLYDRKADPQHRTALHVDIDEADAFVPQRLMPGAERCFGAVDTLVRRGRSSGLAVTLISQRPQVINKDVLSQTEVLVSHQLTGPQDRKALQAWIEANDDENRSAEFMGALASLPKGRAWFWSPGLLKVFKPVNVRDRETFDSSATPKPGVAGVKPKAFAEVDLKKLNAEIAATIEKAKQDDPRELRKEIARLKGEIAKVPAAAVITAKPTIVEVPVLKDAQIARLEKIYERMLAEADKHGKAIAMFWEQQSDEAKALLDVLRVVANVPKVSATIHQMPNQDSRRPAVLRAEHPGRSSAATRPTETRAPRGTDRSGAAGDAQLGNSGLRRMLVALAQRQGLSSRQLGVRAGMSSTSGSFRTYLSQGRVNGWIDGDRHRLVATNAGIAALGEYDPLPEGEGLQAYWLRELGESGASRMLRALASAHPRGLTKDELGAATEMSPTSGSFRTYLSRLRTLELITGKDTILASEELFS